MKRKWYVMDQRKKAPFLFAFSQSAFRPFSGANEKKRREHFVQEPFEENEVCYCLDIIFLVCVEDRYSLNHCVIFPLRRITFLPFIYPIRRNVCGVLVYLL